VYRVLVVKDIALKSNTLQQNFA